MIVAFGNIATSLFAGFVIFAIIGYLAKELDLKVEEVVDQGNTYTIWFFYLSYNDWDHFKRGDSYCPLH